jgi:hypothetical protein
MTSVIFFSMEAVATLKAQKFVVETLSQSCCCVYGIAVEQLSELRAVKGFLGCLQLSDGVTADAALRLVPFVYPVISEHLVAFCATEVYQKFIDSHTEPKRNKSPYVDFLNNDKDAGTKYGSKGHFKAVVLTKVDTKKELNPGVDVVWLPLDKSIGGSKYVTAVFPDEVFKRVAACVYLFQRTLQPTQKGYIANEITNWVISCKDAKTQAHSIYAVVVKDPIVQKMRVYVGQMGKNALYDRWRRSNISGSDTSHIVCISQILRRFSGTEAKPSKIDTVERFQYDDLVMSCCIAEQLKAGNLPDSPVNQTQCWVFPVEWVNSPDLLDQREAHWTVVLGGFDPNDGLNQEMTKKCRKHVSQCEECCNIWVAAAKDKKPFFKDFSKEYNTIWPLKKN